MTISSIQIVPRAPAPVALAVFLSDLKTLWLEHQKLEGEIELELLSATDTPTKECWPRPAKQEKFTSNQNSLKINLVPDNAKVMKSAFSILKRRGSDVTPATFESISKDHSFKYHKRSKSYPSLHHRSPRSRPVFIPPRQIPSRWDRIRGDWDSPPSPLCKPRRTSTQSAMSLSVKLSDSSMPTPRDDSKLFDQRNIDVKRFISLGGFRPVGLDTTQHHPCAPAEMSLNVRTPWFDQQQDRMVL
jgi:hypothetical protein